MMDAKRNIPRTNDPREVEAWRRSLLADLARESIPDSMSGQKNVISSEIEDIFGQIATLLINRQELSTVILDEFNRALSIMQGSSSISTFEDDIDPIPCFLTKEISASTEVDDIFGRALALISRNIPISTEIEDIFGRAVALLSKNPNESTEQEDIFGRTISLVSKDISISTGFEDVFDGTTTSMLFTPSTSTEIDDIFGKTLSILPKEQVVSTEKNDDILTLYWIGV